MSGARDVTPNPMRVIEWLTQKQAAELSGYTERTIRNYIAQGVLPAYRSRGGRGIRIKRSDLDGLFVRVPRREPVEGDAS